jgi:hypothetical protein
VPVTMPMPLNVCVCVTHARAHAHAPETAVTLPVHPTTISVQFCSSLPIAAHVTANATHAFSM